MTDPIPDASTPTAVSTTPRADGLPTRDPEAAQSAISSANERPPLDIARRIVELAEDKKAADIVLLDLAGLTTLADAFVICSGGSERQLDAIADGIIEGMRDEKIRPIGREGTASSHWVLRRLRLRRRPRLHAARARLLLAREALVRGEDGPPRPVSRRGGPARRDARPRPNAAKVPQMV